MEQKIIKFRESDKSLKNEWGQIKGPPWYSCLIGFVVTLWSLFKRLHVRITLPIQIIFVAESTEFREN